MISRIWLKNFKCYEDSKLENLTNISAITGRNNSGKSSFLQILILLKHWLNARPINWFPPGYNMHSFNEVALNPEKPIIFGFEMNIEEINKNIYSIDEKTSSLIKTKPNEPLNSIGYEATINNNNLISEKYFAQNEIIFHNKQPQSDLNLKIKEERIYINNNNFPLSVNSNNADFNNYISIFRNYIQNSNHLSPYRDIPWENQIQRKNLNPDHNGQRSSDIIHHLFSEQTEEFQTLKEKLLQFDPELENLLSPVSTGQSQIRFKRDENNIHLLNMGTGIFNVLPLILHVLLLKSGSTLFIEEPETHLHRGAQVLLMDFLIEEAKKNQKQVIFTTHSIDIMIDLWGRVNKDKSLEELISTFNIEIDGKNRKIEKVHLKQRIQEFREEFNAMFTRLSV